MGTKQAPNTGGANCITVDVFMGLVQRLFVDRGPAVRAVSACKDAGIVSNTPYSGHVRKGHFYWDSVKLAKLVSSGKMPVPLIESMRQLNLWVEVIFNASMGERIHNMPLRRAFMRAIDDGLTKGLDPNVGSRAYMCESKKFTRDMLDNLPACGEEESANEVLFGKTFFFIGAGLTIETNIKSLTRCLVEWARLENLYLNSDVAKWADRQRLTGSSEPNQLLHTELDILFGTTECLSPPVPSSISQDEYWTPKQVVSALAERKKMDPSTAKSRLYRARGKEISSLIHDGKTVFRVPEALAWIEGQRAPKARGAGVQERSGGSQPEDDSVPDYLD